MERHPARFVSIQLEPKLDRPAPVTTLYPSYSRGGGSIGVKPRTLVPSWRRVGVPSFGRELGTIASLARPRRDCSVERPMRTQARGDVSRARNSHELGPLSDGSAAT